MSSHRKAERLTGALELALVWALATAPAAWAGDAPEVCFQTARKIESDVQFQELLLVDADGRRQGGHLGPHLAAQWPFPGRPEARVRRRRGLERQRRRGHLRRRFRHRLPAHGGTKPPGPVPPSVEKTQAWIRSTARRTPSARQVGRIEKQKRGRPCRASGGARASPQRLPDFFGSGFARCTSNQSAMTARSLGNSGQPWPAPGFVTSFTVTPASRSFFSIT